MYQLYILNQLLVTGLTVGNEKTWQWLDMITGIVLPYKKFDETMSFCDMMTCIKKFTLLEVHRDKDKDFKAITDQIKKKGWYMIFRNRRHLSHCSQK